MQVCKSWTKTIHLFFPTFNKSGISLILDIVSSLLKELHSLKKTKNKQKHLWVFLKKELWNFTKDTGVALVLSQRTYLESDRVGCTKGNQILWGKGMYENLSLNIIWYIWGFIKNLDLWYIYKYTFYLICYINSLWINYIYIFSGMCSGNYKHIIVMILRDKSVFVSLYLNIWQIKKRIALWGFFP